MESEVLSLFSNDFILVNAKLQVKHVIALALGLNPEYLLVSRVQDNNHFLYVIHRATFLQAVKEFNPIPDELLESFLCLRESDSERSVEVPDDVIDDPGTQEIVAKQLSPLRTGDFLVLVRGGQAVGIIDPQKNIDAARRVYRVKGVGHEYPIAAAKGKTTRTVPGAQPELAMEEGKLDLSKVKLRGYVGGGPEVLEVNKFVLERYPQATFPDKVTLEETVPLEVIIKAIQAEVAASSSTKIKIVARPGQREIPIIVIVKSQGFEVVGPYHSTIIVPVEAKDSRPIVFNLKAKSEGWQTISVHFYQDGTYAGEIAVKTQVMLGETEAVSQPRKTTSKWEVSEMPSPPDLTLLIHEKKTHPEFEYDVGLYSAKLGIPIDWFDSIRFIGNPETKFRAIFNDIERGDLPPRAIEESVKAKGRILYDELIPNELKDRYWQIRDRIQSIQVVSEEPWIPWEILKPYRRVNGRVEEDNFLCERYAFSRWIEGLAFRTKKRVREARIVVPADTNLDQALAERDWIENFGQQKFMEVSKASSYEEVMASLYNGGFDLLHFSTHGKYDPSFPNFSGIQLEEHIELKAENISGQATTFGKDNPIVILNACQTGAQGFSLTGVGSWAKQFLEAGSSVFIGTLWSVSDATAFRFTQNLYNQLSQGTPLGEAVRQARNLSKRAGDPSWLAYELFGHPNSTIKFGSDYPF